MITVRASQEDCFAEATVKSTGLLHSVRTLNLQTDSREKLQLPFGFAGGRGTNRRDSAGTRHARLPLTGRLLRRGHVVLRGRHVHREIRWFVILCTYPKIAEIVEATVKSNDSPHSVSSLKLQRDSGEKLQLPFAFAGCGGTNRRDSACTRHARLPFTGRLLRGSCRAVSATPASRHPTTRDKAPCIVPHTRHRACHGGPSCRGLRAGRLCKSVSAPPAGVAVGGARARGVRGGACLGTNG